MATWATLYHTDRVSGSTAIGLELPLNKSLGSFGILLVLDTTAYESDEQDLLPSGKHFF